MKNNNKLSNSQELEKEQNTIKEDKKAEFLSKKEQAKKIVAKVFPQLKDKPVRYKDIHNGYTNFSFLVSFDEGQQQYQVRIPHDGKIINRQVEYDLLFNYLKTKDFVYFDKNTGIAVKHWLPGSNPPKRVYKSPKFLEKLFSNIKKIHNLEPKKGHKFPTLKFDAYNQNLYRLKFIYQKKYLCLSDRRRNDKLTINHTDINPLNIIHHKDSIKIIDFEWATIAPDYFDYANYVRESGIKYKKIDWSKYIENFDMQIFEHYLFMTSVYAYLWTYAMPQTHKIIKYRFTTYKQIRKYYPACINEDTNCYVGLDKKDEKNKNDD